MLAFTVRVGYTDRVGHYHTFADVLADTETEAHLLAAQLVDAVRREACHGFVTSTSTVACVA